MWRDVGDEYQLFFSRKTVLDSYHDNRNIFDQISIIKNHEIFLKLNLKSTVIIFLRLYYFSYFLSMCDIPPFKYGIDYQRSELYTYKPNNKNALTLDSLFRLTKTIGYCHFNEHSGRGPKSSVISDKIAIKQ